MSDVPRRADLHVLGQIADSSNHTFVVADSNSKQFVYKPLQGEAPLADFPPGLYRREIAAHLLADSLGWPNIPVTTECPDGPYGVGSLQELIDAHFEHHYLSLRDQHSLAPAFKTLAVFDLVANNADRKSGHVLIDGEDQIWGIDNALCFHAETKLRTVIWDFGGQDIEDDLLADLERVRPQLGSLLETFLEPGELQALDQRFGAVIKYPRLPVLESQRQLPWPLV